MTSLESGQGWRLGAEEEEKRENRAQCGEEQSHFPKGRALALLSVGHQALADALWATGWGGSGRWFSISRLPYIYGILTSGNEFAFEVLQTFHIWDGQIALAAL